MSNRRLRRNLSLLAAGAALMGVGYGIAHVRAEGVPTAQPLWYSGTVADDAGMPLDGNYATTVGLFVNEVPAGGDAALCSVGPSVIRFTDGRFRIDVSACVETLQKTPDLYVELTVDGNPDDNNPGKPFARAKIGAVPFALEAQHAVSATEAAHAGTADMATNAAKATTADSATKATTADSATKAKTADSATNATNATTATKANAVATAGVFSGGACTASASFTDCPCPAGSIAVAGGGCVGANANCGGDKDIRLVETRPNANGGWRVACENGAGTRVQCPNVGKARCLKVQ